ncbi:MAG: LysE family translocator [Deltaproteobacteria bacterium]|nr:LysE family translocator [Deltaproteobacteria bacterium]MBN2671102.1 LysE family translocator [Deltaproteobacteria bacterium]
MFFSWLSLAVVCLLGAMSPGPSFVVVARNALFRGKAAGVAAAWAHAAGICFWAFLTVAGMTVMIKTVPVLFLVVSALGSVYLGWLGVRAFFTSTGVLDEVRDASVGTMWKGAREGALIAFLNPKTGLFFLALFSPFVKPGAETVWQCIMVATPFFTDGVWFSFVTLVLVRPRVLSALKSHSKMVNRISGTVLLGFAIAVLVHATRFGMEWLAY